KLPCGSGVDDVPGVRIDIFYGDHGQHDNLPLLGGLGPREAGNAHGSNRLPLRFSEGSTGIPKVFPEKYRPISPTIWRYEWWEARKRRHPDKEAFA
ncbi:unnamed protein product, partial [Ectocarpus sp. 13 AM-2016]